MMYKASYLSYIGIYSILLLDSEKGGLDSNSNFHIKTDTTMAVPKRKTTPSRRGMRRSHDRIRSGTYIEDPDSKELRLRHHIDLKTGRYRDKQILDRKDEY